MDKCKYNVSPYPTTQMVMGDISGEEHIEASALELYDEWCCDRRWNPEDIGELIKIAIELREKGITKISREGYSI